MSSSVWDWVAVLVGLRSADGLFVPTYWSVLSELTVPFGWAFAPSTVLWGLSLLSVIGVAMFAWRKRSVYLRLSFAIWGALLGDTPFAVLMPIAVFAAWFAIVRPLGTLVKVPVGLSAVSLKRLGLVYALAFLAVFVCNLSRMGTTYITGYFRNAWAALRWDGGWHPLTVAEMDRLLDDYVSELARESAGCRWIFTDGLCDAGIEIAAKGKVRAVPMTDGDRTTDSWRRLGFDRGEDLAALERGAGGLLRTWAVDRPEMLTNATYQCGFAFLEKEAANRLETCGMVLRTVGVDLNERQRAEEATRRLGADILAFYKRGGDTTHGGRIREARFCAMQWRVARAIRRHATELDHLVKTKSALAATAISEKLDAANRFARKQSSSIEYMDLKAFSSLTPREGLAFSLNRANFALARQFALPIVRDDPENPEANFALAMSHLELKEYAQARHYLLIALRSRSEDAALLNNIAVCSLQLGDVQDAAEKSKAALRLMPDSEAVKDTIRNVEQKRQELRLR